MPKRKESARSKAARNAPDLGSGSYRPSAEERRRREQDEKAKQLEAANAEKHRLKYIEQLEADLSGEKPKPVDKENLTKRQREVACCLAEELDDDQIANKLIISAETVSKHRQNIRKKWKMNTQDMKAMQAEAKRRGYGGGR